MAELRGYDSVQDDTLLPVSPLRIVEAGDRGQIAAHSTPEHAYDPLLQLNLYYVWTVGLWEVTSL